MNDEPKKNWKSKLDEIIQGLKTIKEILQIVTNNAKYIAQANERLKSIEAKMERQRTDLSEEISKTSQSLSDKIESSSRESRDDLKAYLKEMFEMERAHRKEIFEISEQQRKELREDIKDLSAETRGIVRVKPPK